MKNNESVVSCTCLTLEAAVDLLLDPLAAFWLIRLDIDVVDESA